LYLKKTVIKVYIGWPRRVVPRKQTSCPFTGRRFFIAGILTGSYRQDFTGEGILKQEYTMFICHGYGPSGAIKK